MFWTEDKLRSRIAELADYRYRDAIALDEWTFAEDETAANGVASPPADLGGRSFRRGERWKGRGTYAWLSRTVAIPAAWRGRDVVGRFDFGKTGAGHNAGFESLLYVNGAPYQGVDSNHQEVFVPGEWAGTEASFVFRLWAGLEGGGRPTEQEHEFRRAELAWLDPAADELYYTARAMLSSAEALGDDRPEKHQLIKALNRAFRLIDWSVPGNAAFYETVAAAAEALRSSLEAMGKTSAVTVNAIGHTHIDVAWLWRLTHTREKAARSFSTVLRLMERYPEYVFLQTQPQLYAYIKQDYPEIYEKIKARVAEGRWEAGGAMWLEADCNLTSGESLVRQILHGTRFFRDEFGVDCKYLWLPDVFGYSWALPQILRKSGIETFMTTKISWNQYNRMPHDTFKWRGMDGTEILTHFVTTPEVADANVWWYTYNGLIEPFAVKGIWDSYRDKAVNQELLLSYGYGDGGGGVNRDMLEMRRRLDLVPGMPNVKTGRADDYFERLGRTVAETDQYVHTWDGELYLEYHRGTYTSQAYNKRMNRKLELLYREAEWLQTWRAVAGGSWADYPQERLAEGWRTILRNQFHDIIPGSSIPEVYADSRAEYADAERIGREAHAAAAGKLASPEQGGDVRAVTVWNGASFCRSDVVNVPARAGWEQGAWTDAAGVPLAAQRTGRGWAVRVNDLPMLGAGEIRFQPAAADGGVAPASPFVLDMAGSTWTTPHYVLRWNEAGQLTSILDRQAGREVLAEGAKGNVLQVFEDKPKMFEAWDIDLYYQEKQREITDLQAMELVENGPLLASVKFVWRYGSSAIEQVVTAYADSRRIDFATRVDWHERQQLLKAAFPVSVRATEATYDIQFGNVKRPTHWNTSWDYARFETVGHQWVDLSERGYGVSLLNDCKYGHDIKDNVIRLSLIKSAIYPDPNADQGTHEFTYALLPHAGDWVEAGTAQEAWSLNNPLTIAFGRTQHAGKSLVRTDAPNVAIDAVKKAEQGDTAIVRLHEFTGARGAVRLTSDYGAAQWQECDLLERPIGEPTTGASAEFRLKPYELKTFRVTFR